MNRDVLAALVMAYKTGRLAHAYLFIGPKGVGKYETAMGLARQVNCLADGADPEHCSCDSCRKISGGNHPDVFVLKKPEEKTGIGIEQVRTLIERLEFRALEARVKFAVIREADLLNDQSANAFLKTLEEPRPGTVIILTTTTPAQILSTIRSRCQAIRFPSMTNAALAQMLKQSCGVSLPEAVVLAGFGQGSLGRAMELGEGFLARRAALLDGFFGMGDSESFVKSAGQDRDTAREALQVILMALRDALLFKVGASEYVVNDDRKVELRRFSERYTPRELGRHVELVSDALRRLDGNQNVKLVLTVVREMMR